ncbi:MAG: hypothetical protein H2069_05860 [Legionella sp.]|nr:hypothetical protein [Legionella sp.]
MENHVILEGYPINLEGSIEQIATKLKNILPLLTYPTVGCNLLFDTLNEEKRKWLLSILGPRDQLFFDLHIKPELFKVDGQLLSLQQFEQRFNIGFMSPQPLTMKIEDKYFRKFKEYLKDSDNNLSLSDMLTMCQEMTQTSKKIKICTDLMGHTSYCTGFIKTGDKIPFLGKVKVASDDLRTHLSDQDRSGCLLFNLKTIHKTIAIDANYMCSMAHFTAHGPDQKEELQPFYHFFQNDLKAATANLTFRLYFSIGALHNGFFNVHLLPVQEAVVDIEKNQLLLINDGFNYWKQLRPSRPPFLLTKEGTVIPPETWVIKKLKLQYGKDQVWLKINPNHLINPSYVTEDIQKIQQVLRDILDNYRIPGEPIQNLGTFLPGKAEPSSRLKAHESFNKAVTCLECPSKLNGNRKDAITHLKHAINALPFCPIYYRLLSWVYYIDHYLPEAMAYHQTADYLDELIIDITFEYSYSRLGTTFIDLNAFDKNTCLPRVMDHSAAIQTLIREQEINNVQMRIEAENEIESPTLMQTEPPLNVDETVEADTLSVADTLSTSKITRFLKPILPEVLVFKNTSLIAPPLIFKKFKGMFNLRYNIELIPHQQRQNLQRLEAKGVDFIKKVFCPPVEEPIQSTTQKVFFRCLDQCYAINIRVDVLNKIESTLIEENKLLKELVDALLSSDNPTQLDELPLFLPLNDSFQNMDPENFYRQGRAAIKFYKPERGFKMLNKAVNYFQQAINLLPLCDKYYYALFYALCLQGEVAEEAARETFINAQFLSKIIEKLELLPSPSADLILPLTSAVSTFVLEEELVTTPEQSDLHKVSDFPIPHQQNQLMEQRVQPTTKKIQKLPKTYPPSAGFDRKPPNVKRELDKKTNAKSLIVALFKGTSLIVPPPHIWEDVRKNLPIPFEYENLTLATRIDRRVNEKAANADPLKAVFCAPQLQQKDHSDLTINNIHSSLFKGSKSLCLRNVLPPPTMPALLIKKATATLTAPTIKRFFQYGEKFGSVEIDRNSLNKAELPSVNTETGLGLKEILMCLANETLPNLNEYAMYPPLQDSSETNPEILCNEGLRSVKFKFRTILSQDTLEDAANYFQQAINLMPLCAKYHYGLFYIFCLKEAIEPAKVALRNAQFLEATIENLELDVQYEPEQRLSLSK